MERVRHPVAVMKLPNSARWSTRFAGLDPFGALEVADVADDGVDLFGRDVRDRRHIAEVPVVCSDAFVYGVVEGEVGVVSDFVEAIDEGWASRRAVGVLAMADGAAVLEGIFAGVRGGFGNSCTGGWFDLV